MRERLRSFDSKITFFAFADIITAVSGMLIFITLLLATDLGRPTDSRTQAANPQAQQQIEETLSQQMEVDAKNRNLQQLLVAAETAPGSEKLETDITRLRAQLAEEKMRHASVADQLAASQSAVEARDCTLGLTGLKAQIQELLQEAQSLASQEAEVRKEMAVLDLRVAGVQSRLLKLHQWEGKLWLIPDRNSTTKEPILAVVSGAGIKVQRFDHPDQTREFSGPNSRTAFGSYLGEAKPLDQYFVFMVKPSGIALFGRLVKSTRDKGFEVGFDAVEEDKNVYFSTPQIPDDTSPTPLHTASQGSPGGGGYSEPAGATTGPGTSGGQRAGGRSSATSTDEAESGAPIRAGTARGGRSGNATGSGTGQGSGPGVGSRTGAGTTEDRGNNAAPENPAVGSIGDSTNADANDRKADASPSAAADSKKEQHADASQPAPLPAPKPKSWWQRLLDWLASCFK